MPTIRNNYYCDACGRSLSRLSIQWAVAASGVPLSDLRLCCPRYRPGMAFCPRQHSSDRKAEAWWQTQGRVPVRTRA